MILVTYNLRSGGAARTHWSRILETFEPDVFLVQETVAPEHHLPSELHNNARRRTSWQAVAGRQWGSAIYATKGTLRPINLPDFHGHVAAARIKRANRPGRRNAPLVVVSIHAPVRGNYHRAMGEILDMIAAHVGRCDLVIGGDFNIGIGERHSSEDRPTTRADLAIQRRLQDEFGLINCWQAANPNQPLAQTLRWSNAPAIPYHCDGLFVPRSWLPRLLSCEVVSSAEWDRLSDHSPVVATFAE